MIHDNEIRQLQNEISELRAKHDEYRSLSTRADEALRVSIDIQAVEEALIRRQAWPIVRENIRSAIAAVESQITSFRQKQCDLRNDLALLRQRRLKERDRIEFFKTAATGPNFRNIQEAEGAIAALDLEIAAAERALNPTGEESNGENVSSTFKAMVPIAEGGHNDN